MSKKFLTEFMSELSFHFNLEIVPQSSYLKSVAIRENGFEFPLVIHDLPDGLVVTNQLFKFWIPEYEFLESDSNIMNNFFILLRSIMDQFPIEFRKEDRADLLELVRCSFKDREIPKEFYKFDLTTSTLDTEVVIKFKSRVFRLPGYLLLSEEFRVLDSFADYINSICDLF